MSYLDTLRRTAIVHSWPRTRVKFFGDFRAELKKTLLELEKKLTQDIAEHFSIDSCDVGNNDIKIRVRDESVGSQKILSAIFRFHHDDEKYGNVHIEILVSEVSRKNQSLFLGKYLVTDRKKILPDVSKAIILGIRAI